MIDYGLKIYVDAGTRYGGICLIDPQKGIVVTKKRNGVRTNNELEYLAVIYGLEYYSDNYESSDIVTIYSDSLLIVNQVNGKYRTTQESLEKLKKKVLGKMNDGVMLKWVPRRLNLAGRHLEKFY